MSELKNLSDLVIAKESDDSFNHPGVSNVTNSEVCAQMLESIRKRRAARAAKDELAGLRDDEHLKYPVTISAGTGYSNDNGGEITLNAGESYNSADHRELVVMSSKTSPYKALKEFFKKEETSAPLKTGFNIDECMIYNELYPDIEAEMNAALSPYLVEEIEKDITKALTVPGEYMIEKEDRTKMAQLHYLLEEIEKDITKALTVPGEYMIEKEDPTKMAQYGKKFPGGESLSVEGLKTAVYKVASAFGEYMWLPRKVTEFDVTIERWVYARMSNGKIVGEVKQFKNDEDSHAYIISEYTNPGHLNHIGAFISMDFAKASVEKYFAGTGKKVVE